MPRKRPVAIVKATGPPRSKGGLTGWRFWQPASILLAGLLAYAPSFRGQWILDDYIGIVTNGRVHKLWPLHDLILDTRPVVDFTFALNFALHGLWLPGFHAVNLCIHLLAALTLYGLAFRTFALKRLVSRFGEAGPTLAWCIALLWVVHPLCTQAVTYTVQRAESLMGLFFLLTLYCLNRSTSARLPRGWLCSGVLCCCVGMGCKAVMAAAPMVALLYDRIFLSTSWKETCKRRGWGHASMWLSLLLLWPVGVLGGLFQREAGGATTVGFAMQDVTAWQYFCSQPGVILHYLRLCFWPHPLCIDYGWPVAHSAATIIPGAVVVGVCLLCSIWGLWRAPAMGFLGATFFLILAPTSSFVPIRDLAFEHRMYLPLAAIMSCLVAAGWQVVVRNGGKSGRAYRWGRLVFAVISLMAVGTTFSRNLEYADPISLWSSNASLVPLNPRPRNALGFALFKAGRPAEAVEHLREAIRLDPRYAGAYANLGLVQFAQRQFENAVNSFRKALELSPNEFGPDVYCSFGASLLELGRASEALGPLREATHIDPSFVDAHYNLGNALLASRRPEEAVRAFEAAVQLRPDYPEAQVNLGLALSGCNRLEAAVESYRAALSILPSGSISEAAFKARYNLGLALTKLGRPHEARIVLQEAVKLRPGHPGAQSALNALSGT